ncbi:MAG: membrane dipeptidase, partial [Methylococcales bacterium]|nr:membrane dipeptidase [Methylococcales bacterium]
NMRKLKLFTIWLIPVVGLLYFAATLFVPEIVDKKFNTIALSPPYQASEEAQKLYNSLSFISDMHSDTLLWKRDLLKRHDYGSVDIPRMLDARVSVQAFTIVTKAPKNMNFNKNTGDTDQITLPFILQGRPINSWFDLKQRAVAQCNALHRFEEKSDGKFTVIESSSDLNAYLSRKKDHPNSTAGFLGIEGMHALEGKLENVDVLYDAGVRMMAPVHFFDNKLGGSAHGVSKAGLTDFGKQVIMKMQKKDMIVDIAHSSPALIDDVFEISTKPVVSSHTGVKGTCETVRNLSDKHLRLIADSGGLIGIAMFKPATCDSTVASSVKAIQYCIDLVGADFVALGSDFDGAVEVHTDITGLPLYVEEMLKVGISEQDIRKVMGENVKRFLLQNLPE